MDYPKTIEFTRWPDPIDGLPEELEVGNVILITHKHKDHCKLVTVNRLRNENTLILAPQPCTAELGKEIDIIKAGQSRTLGDMHVQVVESYNTEHGSSTQKNHRKGKGVGYVITLEGKKIYHAGDTDLIPEMDALKDIDVALLPIGGKFTMDAEEAVEAAKVINPKVVIPVHHLDADPFDFKRKLEKTTGIKVIPLQIGEFYLL